MGYATSTPEVIDAASAINDLVYVCPAAPLQHGVLKGLQELPKSYYENVAKEHQDKRDRFITSLNEVGFKAEYVKGAYYVLADISSLDGEDAKAKVITLLEKTGIAAVPANAFYHESDGIHLARFCFSKTDAEIDQAIASLQKLL